MSQLLYLKFFIYFFLFQFKYKIQNYVFILVYLHKESLHQKFFLLEKVLLDCFKILISQLRYFFQQFLLFNFFVQKRAEILEDDTKARLREEARRLMKEAINSSKDMQRSFIVKNSISNNNSLRSSQTDLRTLGNFFLNFCY